MPKYLLDQMFNGLIDELRKEHIECDTATHAILHSNDSRISIKDDEIIAFLENEGRDFTLITADMRFARRCEMLKLNCTPVDQKQLVLDHIRKLKT